MALAIHDVPAREDVRTLIRELGMTHQQVADALGVSRSAVDKWTAELDARTISKPCWALLLLLADKHPDFRLISRSGQPAA